MPCSLLSSAVQGIPYLTGYVKYENLLCTYLLYVCTCTDYYTLVYIYIYVWQSRVENEHYSGLAKIELTEANNSVIVTRNTEKDKDIALHTRTAGMLIVRIFLVCI